MPNITFFFWSCNDDGILGKAVKTSSHTDHRHGKSTKCNTDELNSVWTQIKITLTARTPPRAPPLRRFWAHLPAVQRNQEPVLFPSSGGTSETVYSSWLGSRGPPLYFHLAGLAFFFIRLRGKVPSLFFFFTTLQQHTSLEGNGNRILCQ